jgi:hypothetical protein
MRGITLIFGICAAASLVPVHAQDDAKHGIEGTAVSNPHIDIARVKPIDLTAGIAPAAVELAKEALPTLSR